MKKITFSILLVLSGLLGMSVGTFTTEKKLRKKINEEQKISNKHLSLFLMMNQWVKIKQRGKSLVYYFEENEYYNIAIYGMSYAGETLIDELMGSDIKIKYGIDRNKDNIDVSINVVFPEDELENVDAIVVTAIKFFDEIEEELSKKVNCPILSLEDILYEI